MGKEGGRRERSGNESAPWVTDKMPSFLLKIKSGDRARGAGIRQEGVLLLLSLLKSDFMG